MKDNNLEFEKLKLELENFFYSIDNLKSFKKALKLIEFQYYQIDEDFFDTRILEEKLNSVNKLSNEYNILKEKFKKHKKLETFLITTGLFINKIEKYLPNISLEHLKKYNDCYSVKP